MPTSHGHNTVRIQTNPRGNHVLLQTRPTNTLMSKSRKGKGIQRRYQSTNPILPKSTISQHNRDFSSLPRHHQYCPGMEKNNDKFKPTSLVLTLRSRAPNLPLISQFQTLIQEMECLEYLHVGHYKFHQADIDNRRPQVARLKSMFPNLVINHNPYSTCPNTRRSNIPQSDPSIRFIRNIGPNSWTSRRDAEVVPIFDVN